MGAKGFFEHQCANKLLICAFLHFNGYHVMVYHMLFMRRMRFSLSSLLSPASTVHTYTLFLFFLRFLFLFLFRFVFFAFPFFIFFIRLSKTIFTP